MTYVAAFRTYSWDEGVAELARRFFLASPSGRQVVLADETNGPLQIPNYEVISHTEDTSKYGLLVHPPGGSLWYNVDYGLYILRQRLPGYDYYLTSESDLAVNTDLDAIAGAAARRQLDLIAHLVRPATPDWEWYADAKAVFNDPFFGAVLFFTVLSARALDLLCHVRQQMSLQYRAGQISAWPFCEAFVPSVLKRAQMRIAEVSEFTHTENLRVRPHLLVTDPRANQPDSLAHSVLSKPAYIRATLKEHPPRDWFSAASGMRQALRGLALQEYAEPLRRSFAEMHDQDGLADFEKLLAKRGISLR